MTHRAFFKFPLAALTSIVGLYAVFTAIALLNNWTVDLASLRDQMWGTRLALLGIGSVIAGVLRISNFHPRFSTKYGAWLSATPWRPGIDLPLGPVSLVLEDLLLLVPLTLLAVADAHVPEWVPVTGYLLGYCGMSVASLKSRHTVWFAFSLVLLAGFPVHFHSHLAVLYAVLLTAVMFAHLALSRSLEHFPWDLGDSMRELKRLPRAGLAWPLNRVGPAAPAEPILPEVGFASAALCGWWTWVLLNLLHNWGDRMGDMMLRLVAINQLPGVGVMLAVLRVLAFCTLYWPPISLWGRVRSGRWIIPGYDYVFISPLLICVISFALPRILSPFLPLAMVGALTVALIAAVYFNGGPSLRSWQLTGHHRMLPGARREPPAPKARIVLR